MRRKVAIIGGCGHVGLPLGLALAPHHEVILYDIDAAAVERVRRGELPFREEGGEEALREALARGLTVTSSREQLSACELLVVVIGTPVDEHLHPSFTVLEALLGQLEEVLRDGQTLVLRSTVYPGTSERVQRRLRQRGRKVEVAFCPERVAEGVALQEIRRLPQLISGFTPEGVQAARGLFSPLGVELIELSPLEAELAKLFTNAWRYISFAVANQFYMAASEWSADAHRILRAMKEDYPRAAHLPMPGFTAGPCLLKDTAQLVAVPRPPFTLGRSAIEVNEGLPRFIVQRMLQRWPDLGRRTVGLLGMAFKAESDDPRESLSYKLKELLERHAAQVLTSDPYVADERLRPEEEVLERADLFVIGAPHQRYRTLDYRGKPVVDVWDHLGQGGRI
jgi:UDP-N-acetyl-D-mannosaminuronic acid dehydrogenase